LVNLADVFSVSRPIAIYFFAGTKHDLTCY